MKKTIISLFAVLFATAMSAQTVTPTWGVTFDNSSDAQGFTTIDVNGDAHTFEGTLRGGWSWMQRTDVEDFTAAMSYYCDSKNAADDWLITPGINLSAGRSYTFSFDAHAANIYPEKFEVYMGKAATAEGMTGQLIAPTVVKTGELEPYSVEFTIDESGVYYIGIHAISDKNQYILSVKNVLIEAGILPEAPAKVNDFTAVADPTGLKKATLTFTLPTLLNNGNALSEITKVEIRRGLEVVKTIEGGTPGEQITYVDAVPEQGLYNYTIVVHNADGDGAPAMQSVYVGYDAPTAPLNPHIVDKLSSIDIVWDQSLGQHGGLIKKSDMSYYIYAIDDEGKISNRIATLDKGKTLYNIKMDTRTGEQKLISYILMAGNSQGLSPTVETKGFLVGKPLGYPFAEHFKNMEIENFWWVNGSGTGYANQYAGFTLGKSSADGGTGSLIFEGFLSDDIVTLHSAKISLAGAEKPWLSFNHKAMEQTPVDLTVQVCRPDGTIDVLKTIDYTASDISNWKRELFDLTPYMTENYITVEFSYANHSDEKATMAYLDNIQIGEMQAYDLAVRIDAPASVVPGEGFEYKTIVTNNGTEPVTNFVFYGRQIMATQALLEDEGTVVDVTLEPTESMVWESSMLLPVELADKPFALEAEVRMPEGITDADESNNKVSVSPKVNYLKGPKPEDVKAFVDTDNTKMEIAWKAPENPSVSVTDDFESYAPWLSSDFGNWKSVDKDGGISEQLFQGYTTGLEDKAFAFATFSLAKLNPGFTDTNEEFNPHSGEQCLAAFFCHDGFYNYRDQNNWLISPELPGTSQKISLYAGNYDVSAPEVFEIMYSLTDDNPDSFIRIGAERRVADGQWHPFTATLPSGARYFAVHHYTPSTDSYMLKLDDISYKKLLDIDHYELFWLNDFVTSTSETSFVDTDAERMAEPANYNVVAVYTDGTRSDAQQATIVDAIKGINGDAGNASVNGKTYNLAGQRVLTNQRGVVIRQGGKYILK